VSGITPAFTNLLPRALKEKVLSKNLEQAITQIVQTNFS